MRQVSLPCIGSAYMLETGLSNSPTNFFTGECSGCLGLKRKARKKQKCVRPQVKVTRCAKKNAAQVLLTNNAERYVRLDEKEKRLQYTTSLKMAHIARNDKAKSRVLLLPYQQPRSRQFYLASPEFSDLE
ncbi:predicted protein [Sclerotinia sclerotiorum 1980 UF-70]|uniref:Uncharacterized protein n=1 Tax=Sclerotinia sclerotiorum (strain ATCC 18683 / 1980 / Ss-1) TaxID=665079 RepID=A7EG12_SCLS1|nr:predicted protein [Sclerotinia sclerotiorum 1980 UF-70]EDO01778.1 predicted protein [Sclerotinia sclerotiorum 1980 UF-70]